MLNRCTPNLPKASFYAINLLLAIMCSISVDAQTPTYAFAGTSGGGNVFPLGSTTNRVQWIYYPSHFTPTLPSTGLITTIYLMPANTVTSSTFTNLEIKLGNSTVTSMTGAAWHTGLTSVYSSPSTTLSWTSGVWKAITLGSTFFYSGGNLILEISQGGYTTGMTIAQNSSLAGGRQWGTTTGAAPSSSGTGQFLIGFDMIPANCSGTPLAPVITNAAMSTASPLCGGTMTLNANNPNGAINGITLQWQQSSSSTGTFTNVTTGSGATTTSYTTGPIATTTWFRLAAHCTNSNITNYSAPYQVLAGAPQPGAITGRPTRCPGDTATYIVPGVFGSTYTWTLPTGWTGSSSSNVIGVTQGSGSGNVSVTATNSCGTSIPRTFSVIAGSAPASPTSISGPNVVCINSTHTYSFPIVAGANSYVWTLPTGWSGTSSTNTITVTTGNTSGSQTISARAVNGCGSSVNQSMSVSVINALTSPGTITTSLASGNTYCSGALYNFSINPVPGATSYVWNLPATWTGAVSGTSVQAFAGTSSGQVTVTAHASCASSATSTLTVNAVPTDTPTVSIAPANPLICQGAPTTFIATPVKGAGTSPVYIWRKNGNAVVSSGNRYIDQTLVSGDKIIAIMVSNAACRSVDSAVSNMINTTVTPAARPGININSLPVVTICKGTDVKLTTTITGGGSSPVYQWYQNGAAINGANGNTYSFNTANNGDTITVQLASSAVCALDSAVSSNKVGFKVNELVNPIVTIAASSTDPQPGQPITFTATQSGGGATPVYQWMLNNVEIPYATSDTYTSSTLKAGDHIALRMQSYDPCPQPEVVFSNEIILGRATGIANASGWNGNVSVYPNPTAGRFTVAASWQGQAANNRITVEVLNMLGQCTYRSEAVPNKSQSMLHYYIALDEELPSGRYMLRLTTANGMSATLPLTLTR